MSATLVSPMDALGGQTNEAVTDLHKALLREHSLDPHRFQSAPPTRLPEAEEARSLKTPGGFRRAHLHKVADEKGIPEENRPTEWNVSLLEKVRPHWHVQLYNSAFGIRIGEDGELLPAEEGQWGVPQTVMAIWKSFVGSGITFLPGAFNQGGWVFSSIVLATIAGCNAVCIMLLLQCGKKTRLTGFGEIAERAAGEVGKQAVHLSLVISQFGTNISYIIFIAQMVESLGSAAYVNRAQVIMIIVIVIIPLSWIRSLERLEYAIIGADVLIVFGLGTVLWFACQNLLAQGPDPEIVSFKPATCGLFMGTAMFTFEGLPYILPIVSSMREPEKFNQVFFLNFLGILTFFCAFGLAGYAAFGQGVQTVVLLSLPQGAASVAARVAYCVALILSSPLVFLSAARITELWVFGVGKAKGVCKWPKNLFRCVVFCIFGIIAVYGGEYFDKFLAFVGAVCCAPIAFIYPSLFHLLLCAEGIGWKVLDVFFIVLGLVAMAFVLWETFG
eukprot:TRINITY_DN7681_c0_g1_i1.p1 TRINITY_DN7681_c0_g1~~TRINITY_DN7681_c0_g1_i1.p1  ORF type:complete len:501 (-),score=73.49 TRINITY_DN7681_c0_g1_i1:58-1560(-)